MLKRELYEEVEVLTPRRFDTMLREGGIELPNISAEDIKALGKGDGLSKTIVLGQTLWFTAQCISRAAQGLVITEIELVTVAFAFLNGFMYFLWWDKPLDATFIIRIEEVARFSLPHCSLQFQHRPMTPCTEYRISQLAFRESIFSCHEDFVESQGSHIFFHVEHSDYSSDYDNFGREPAYSSERLPKSTPITAPVAVDHDGDSCE